METSKPSILEVLFWALFLAVSAGTLGGVGHLAGGRCEHQQHQVVEK